MILELRLPHVERGVSRVRIVKWLKEPGDHVAPGDDIAVVDAEERTKLEIPRSAKLLSKLATANPVTKTRKVTVQVRHRLTVTEPATVLQLIAEPGELCGLGSLLAVLSQDPDESIESDDRRALRAVVNQEQPQ